ncbi:ABC transporter permease [Sulfurimonas diazotrophicus]|uniref:ABC transporter permease n=1 Tax=Sulfurimonas diazotrophicus TaxID=3131939 RepID=A0ABZ3HCF6_9BACT
MKKQRGLTNYLLRRFLRFDREQPFIFLSAMLAFLGIMLGVMVLIIAMALMNGFDNEFKKKLTIMNYPLTIVPRFYGSVNSELLMRLEQEFPQLKFSPYVAASVIARSGSQLEGGYLFGVDFKAEREVNPVVAKGLETLPEGNFKVLVGEALLEAFALGEGDRLMYIFTQIEPGGLAVTPKLKRFVIAGSFDSGLSAYDKAYSYTDLHSLQTIMHLPDNVYDGIHIMTDDPQKVIEEVRSVLPEGVRIKGWWEDNVNFFAALELEKRSLFIVLMLIILIAAVNIISSLLMTVMNRRSEIALLISLGASPAQIKKLFLKLGVVIGIGGIATGAILGLSGVWVLQTFDIITLPKHVYPTARLALDLSWQDFVSILGGAFAIVVLSSWYPAKKASEVDVLTVLRNE